MLKTRSCGFVRIGIFYFYTFENEQSKKFSHVKGTSASLNSFLLLQTFYQVYLSYVVFRVLYFPFFGLSNEIAEIVHVFFVYFVGFVIRFIFATKVLNLGLNTQFKSLNNFEIM